MLLISSAEVQLWTTTAEAGLKLQDKCQTSLGYCGTAPQLTLPRSCGLRAVEVHFEGQLVSQMAPRSKEPNERPTFEQTHASNHTQHRRNKNTLGVRVRLLEDKSIDVRHCLALALRLGGLQCPPQDRSLGSQGKARARRRSLSPSGLEVPPLPGPVDNPPVDQRMNNQPAGTLVLR